MTFRDIKRQARQDLHQHMQVAALYVVETATSGVYTTTEVTVRIHASFKALGDLKGTNFQYAEMQETVPQIRFVAAQVTPTRGGLVSVEAGECYRVDNVLPPDDEFVTAEVVRLSAAQIAALVDFPVPGA